MPTQPLPQSLLSKLESRTQATRWSALFKEVREFRAYCCNIDSDGIMGVAKQPVPIVDLSPPVICLGEDLSWDLTGSYAPGSTISAWEIDFGDGNDDSGATIGSASGSHTYADLGSYTVTIVIEEGLGKTQTVTAEVNVVDCTEPPMAWLYVSTLGQGVHYINYSDDTPAWTARNNGLSGDALKVNSLVLRPGSEHVNPVNHELWAATLDGVYKTENGGQSWSKVSMPDPSNLEFEDITFELTDWQRILFDPNHQDVVYAIATGDGEDNAPALVDTETVDSGNPSAVWHAGFSPGFYVFDDYPGFPNQLQYRTQVAVDGNGNITLSGRTSILDGTPFNASFYYHNTLLDAELSIGSWTWFISPAASGTPAAYTLGSGWYRSMDWLTASQVIRVSPPFSSSVLVWTKDWQLGGEITRTYDFGISGSGEGQHVIRIDNTHALVLYLLGGIFKAKLVFTDIPGDTLTDIVTQDGPACDSASASSCLLLEDHKCVLVYTNAGQNYITSVEVDPSNTTITWGTSNVLAASTTAVGLVNSSTIVLAYITNNGLVDRIDVATAGLSGVVGTPATVYTATDISILIAEPLAVAAQGGFAVVAYADENRDYKVSSVSL